MNFLVLVGSSCYLYLNCKILGERFTHVIKQLEKFTNGRRRIDTARIDRHLQEFGILIDELHKCNFFWSKIMLVNYYFALAICTIELLVGKYQFRGFHNVDSKMRTESRQLTNFAWFSFRSLFWRHFDESCSHTVFCAHILSIAYHLLVCLWKLTPESKNLQIKLIGNQTPFQL